MRPDLEPLPDRMKFLPVDDRGYPVPWFVAWVGGRPEFRAADPGKLRDALRFKRCWVCGEPLGRWQTFVVGPMCGINRTSAEPPSHLECATWSARNCPFLSNAGRRRREDDAINNASLVASSPGVALTRNPGVTLLWTCRSYFTINPGGRGVLLKLGDPTDVRFYAGGRPATLDEVAASVDSGLPALVAMANEEGPRAVAELEAACAAFQRIVRASLATAAVEAR